MKCRHCHEHLEHLFLDLGSAPPSNAYRSAEDLSKIELTYPLQVYVCDNCWLVQTVDFVDAIDLFKSDYAYFSSASTSWLAHAENFTKIITERLSLNQDSFVIEIASNDGYLLKNFVDSNIPCLGIEPTLSTALAAEQRGIPVVQRFFGEKLSQELVSTGKQADLIIANNVFAHVPDINDFSVGLNSLLKLDGTVTLEFAHVLPLIERKQFDTIYHEHFSYLSLHAVDSIFRTVGLDIYDVEELPTHGGSLRVYASKAENGWSTPATVTELLRKERAYGLLELRAYQDFQERVNKVRDELRRFLMQKKSEKKSVVGYGAAAKGNTLLNYAGIKSDLLPFVCDIAESKQGMFLPGSRIPVIAPGALQVYRPNYVLILPWNLAVEVREQLGFIREWGGQFVTALPELHVF